MNNIKNIIWDWNGTIINDAYLFVDIMNQTLTKYNLKNITINDYKANFCFPIKTYWKNLGFNFDDSTFNKMNFEFIQLYKEHMKTPVLQNQIIDVLNLMMMRLDSLENEQAKQKDYIFQIKKRMIQLNNFINDNDIEK